MQKFVKIYKFISFGQIIAKKYYKVKNESSRYVRIILNKNEQTNKINKSWTIVTNSWLYTKTVVNRKELILCKKIIAWNKTRFN